MITKDTLNCTYLETLLRESLDYVESIKHNLGVPNQTDDVEVENLIKLYGLMWSLKSAMRVAVKLPNASMVIEVIQEALEG